MLSEVHGSQWVLTFLWLPNLFFLNFGGLRVSAYQYVFVAWQSMDTRACCMGKYYLICSWCIYSVISSQFTYPQLSVLMFLTVSSDPTPGSSSASYCSSIFIRKYWLMCQRSLAQWLWTSWIAGCGRRSSASSSRTHPM